MRRVEQTGEMVFNHKYSETKVYSPEELAQFGIGIHPAAVDRVWGEGAGDRYLQAMGFNTRGAPTTGGQNG